MVTDAARRAHRWLSREGWTGVWHLVYLASLSAATAAAVTDREESMATRGLVAAVAVLAGTWYVFIALRWRYWEAPPRRFAVLLAVAAALWFPLLVAHPAFWWTVFAAYGVASCPWLRRSVPSIAVLTALLLVADELDGGEPVDAARVATVVAIGALVLLAHATVSAIAHESERRRRLIIELDATRAELAVSERRTGTLAERERLAREIHDALAQGFTSIVMLLEAADAKLPAGSAEVRAPLDQALQTARDSLDEARRMVRGLDAGAATPGALMGSLERLAEQTSAAGGPSVEVVIAGEPGRLDAGQELALLRTAQEAASNARRHAQASHITVTLSWLAARVILDVSDDGQGFGPDRAETDSVGGFGLRGLAQRANEVGGDLTIDSAPGQGTTVILQLSSQTAGERSPSRTP